MDSRVVYIRHIDKKNLIIHFFAREVTKEASQRQESYFDKWKEL